MRDHRRQQRAGRDHRHREREPEHRGAQRAEAVLRLACFMATTSAGVGVTKRAAAAGEHTPRASSVTVASRPGRAGPDRNIVTSRDETGEPAWTILAVRAGRTAGRWHGPPPPSRACAHARRVASFAPVTLPAPAPTLSTLLRLTGRDALDLLHRISTQSLEDLGAGEQRATLFCDFRARLLFRAHVARLHDDSVWLVHELAPGAALAAHLDRHIFREDVKVEDWSDRLTVRGRIHSPARVGAPVLVVDDLPGRLVVADGVALEILPAGVAPLTAFQLQTWELSRIATGRPRHGHEISDAFHPFEVGLWDDVHLSKGCYTGQEVLQRLVTYRSVRRHLARVAAAGAPPATPVAVCVGDERVGTVTSAIAAGTGWAGLAVLGDRAFESGAEVSVEDGAALSEIAPFAARPPRGLPEGQKAE